METTPQWAELNPKALLETQNKKYCLNGKSQSPNMPVKSLNPLLLRTKPTSTPSLNSKARIREESVSECSLSDEDMTQIKSITITLGSANSINNHVYLGKENGAFPSENVDTLRLRTTNPERPNNQIVKESNGISKSTF